MLDLTIQCGNSIIRGTRSTVADIRDCLTGGMSPSVMVADFADPDGAV